MVNSMKTMICDENEDLYGEVTFRCKLKDEDQVLQGKKKWQGIDLGGIELCKNSGMGKVIVMTKKQQER